MQILTDSYDVKSFLGETPILTCTIRVTDQCNLKCVQCYSRGGEKCDTKVLSFDEMVGLLLELKKHNVMRLSITGGEPFMRTDMLDILERASQLGFEIYISTNGNLSIDFKRLANIKVKVMQISVDGTQELHDEIRGQKGSFSKAIDFIKNIKCEAPNTKIGVAFTLMKRNKDCMIELFEILRKLHIDIFSIIPVQRIGRAIDEYSLSPIEIQQRMGDMAEHWRKTGKDVELNTMVAPALVPKVLRMEGIYSNGYLCTFPYCIAVSADGRFSLCDGLLDNPEFTLGTVKDGLKAVIQNERIQSILQVSSCDLSGVCAKCIVRDFCVGGCRADAYNASKSLGGPDVMCQSYYTAGIFPREFMEN